MALEGNARVAMVHLSVQVHSLLSLRHSLPHSLLSLSVSLEPNPLSRLSLISITSFKFPMMRLR